MKILFLFFLSLPALAAPPCWTTDGSEIGLNKEGTKIADGQFLITVDVNQITKENLVLVMQKVKFGNIEPSSYPTILDDTIVFHVKSISENTERLLLIEAVNAQIDELLAIPGVKEAGCNGVTGQIF